MSTQLARALPMDDEETELRVELLKSELVVLYAHKQATGISNKDVIRELLAVWSEKKRHEWTVGCRVAGINPTAPQSSRDTGAGTSVGEN